MIQVGIPGALTAFIGYWRVLLSGVLILGFPAGVASAAGPGHESAQYQLVESFLRWPAEIEPGQVAGVAIDSRGNIIVAHRADPPILIFSKDGNFLRAFGTGLLPAVHGTRIDQHDHLWVTDITNHTVIKFDLQGDILMTLGERDVPGEDENHFNRPTDVAVAPNGDFYVSDGYGNSRVVKFDKTGKFLLTWGRKGSAEGEFNLPHGVLLDREGRVYVADRENDRIQVFDSNGKFIRMFGDFAPFGIFLTPERSLFIADGRAHQALKVSLQGDVLVSWGSQGQEPGQFNLPHGITVDREGAVYVTEIEGQRIQKFAPAMPDS